MCFVHLAIEFMTARNQRIRILKIGKNKGEQGCIFRSPEGFLDALIEIKCLMQIGGIIAMGTRSLACVSSSSDSGSSLWRRAAAQTG